MAEAIFHIGMGKTGTSSIQAALRDSPAALRAGRARYMGMWMGQLDTAFEGLAGFNRFRDQDASSHRRLAETLARQLGDLAEREDATRFIFSNEAYLPLLENFRPFFERLAERIDLRVVAYARPVGSWLPSACAQWSVLHKTNAGPVESLAEAGDRMMAQYAPITGWIDLLGERVTLRLFERGIDPLADFSELIGIKLGSDGLERQARLPLSEQMLRAAVNNQVDAPCLPDFAEATFLPKKRRGRMPLALSERFRFLFDNSQFAPVIERHAPMLREIEARTGIDLLSAPVPDAPAYDPAVIEDEIIGSLLDIASRQSVQLRRAERRLNDMERRLAALETRLAAK
ncbi:hypothetical protein [Poseidonocella sp. HB161398]|uniref:hypothetical protein n=1 Tax=Poseidonocella sp. HB161398 TaxID=2320855 RepID=UPI0011085A3C|nr:hypothetical protein [Poseidonocella sp. HB161398]